MSKCGWLTCESCGTVRYVTDFSRAVSRKKCRSCSAKSRYDASDKNFLANVGMISAKTMSRGKRRSVELRCPACGKIRFVQKSQFNRRKSDMCRSCAICFINAMRPRARVRFYLECPLCGVSRFIATCEFKKRRSAMCHACRMVAMHGDPEFKKRMSASSSARMRAKHAANPQLRAQAADRLRVLNSNPEFREARDARMRAILANPDFVKRRNERFIQYISTAEFKERQNDRRKNDPEFKFRVATGNGLWYLPKDVRRKLTREERILLSDHDIRRSIIAEIASALSMESPT